MKDLDSYVELYRKAQAKKDALTKSYKEKVSALDDIIEEARAKILEFMNREGIESIKTGHGHVIRKRTVKPYVVDWDKFYRYVRDNDALHLLQKRIAARNVMDEMDERQAMVPGVHVDTSYTIQVKKK